MYFNNTAISQDGFYELLWKYGKLYSFEADGNTYYSNTLTVLRAKARRMIESDKHRPVTYGFKVTYTYGGGRVIMYQLKKMKDGSIEWHDISIHGKRKIYQLNRNGTLGTRLSISSR